MPSQKNKINIAFYTLNLKNSGVFKIISTLSSNLPDNYSVHIFVSDIHPKDFTPSFALGGEIHFFDIPDPDNRSIFSKVYKNYVRKKLLKKYKKDNNIDITITFSENPNIHNIITKCNDKVIISVHSFTSRNIIDNTKSNLHTFFYDKMIKKYFKRADRVVAVSEGIKYDLIDKFSVDKNKIDVLYNPHDIGRIVDLSKQNLDVEFEELYADSFTIINIGRICPAKGHWNLVRAFSLVKKEIPNAKLIIMGDAATKLKLFIKELISDLGLENSIHLLNFQSNPYNFLKQADVYVSSSIYEGLPNVLIEALACSTPVVSTDCKSGPREILAPTTNFQLSTDQVDYAEFGVLTPSSKQELLDSSVPITKAEKLLAEAIIKLYKDTDLRNTYSEKGLQRVSKFKIEKIIGCYDSLFKEILSK